MKCGKKLYFLYLPSDLIYCISHPTRALQHKQLNKKTSGVVKVCDEGNPQYRNASWNPPHWESLDTALQQGRIPGLTTENFFAFSIEREPLLKSNNIPMFQREHFKEICSRLIPITNSRKVHTCSCCKTAIESRILKIHNFTMTFFSFLFGQAYSENLLYSFSKQM